MDHPRKVFNRRAIILLLCFSSKILFAQNVKKTEKNWALLVNAFTEEAKAAKNIATFALDYSNMKNESDSVTTYALALINRTGHLQQPDSASLQIISKTYESLERHTHALIGRLSHDKNTSASKVFAAFTAAAESQSIRIVIAIHDYNEACKELKKFNLLFPVKEEAATVDFDK